MKNKIKIIVADDHPLWQKILVDLLKVNHEFEVIGVASNGVQLIELIKKQKPDLIILDVRMPEMDGDEALKIIKEKHPEIHVIMLSEYCYENSMIIYYIENGASSALSKSLTGENLVNVIVSVMADQPCFAENILKELSRRDSKKSRNRESLTKQEKSILLDFCKEKSIKEVAEIHHLSIGTIKLHKASIYRKTNSKSEAGLVKYAYKRGWF